MLLDCPLEYKKGESQTNIEMLNPSDWKRYLEIEEEYIKKLCDSIIALKPDVVFTEKGVSDLAQHFLQIANISVIRRVRKSDNNRIARATGATICHQPELMHESDIGTRCGVFEVRKIGDEYWTFLDECESPKACTIVLRGASKDVLSEIERNLHDAMNVSRNLISDPRILPGGGATELALAETLRKNSRTMKDVSIRPYQAVASAIEIIPKTLIQNCGGQVVRLLTELRAKHASTKPGEGEAGSTSSSTYGIDGTNGKMVDMKELGVWEPFLVKSQTIKTAIESATILLRIDDILSGISKGKGGGGAPAGGQQPDPETFGDERDG